MLGLRLQPLSLVPTPRHCWPQEKRGQGWKWYNREEIREKVKKLLLGWECAWSSPAVQPFLLRRASWSLLAARTCPKHIVPCSWEGRTGGEGELERSQVNLGDK